jgi:glycosyltransferase involved in cell wall biosynthesis
MKLPLRVLVLGTIPDRSEAALLLALAARGVQIEAFFESRSTRLDDLRAAGVAIETVTLSNRQRHTEADHLAARIRAFAPDVVHVLRSKSLRLLRAAGGHHWPPTVFYRGTIEPPRWWSFSDRRKFFDPRIRRYIAVSDAVRGALVAGGVAPERVTVIRKGHDRSWYATPAVDLRAELHLPRDTFLAGVIANIRWEKGVGYAVDAACLLARRGRRVHLVLLGNDERPWWQRRLQPLARPGLVSLLGHRTDVAALLPSFDALLIPSLREGSPRVAAEAMLRGIPVVASAVGGLPELVADGRTGLLVPARDAAALADAVERLIDTPGLGATLAEAARRFFLDHVTVERAADQTLRLYEDVIAESTSRRGIVQPTRVA